MVASAGLFLERACHRVSCALSVAPHQGESEVKLHVTGCMSLCPRSVRCQFPQENSHLARHIPMCSKRKWHKLVPASLRLPLILAPLQFLRFKNGVLGVGESATSVGRTARVHDRDVRLNRSLTGEEEDDVRLHALPLLDGEPNILLRRNALLPSELDQTILEVIVSCQGATWTTNQKVLQCKVLAASAMLWKPWRGCSCGVGHLKPHLLIRECKLLNERISLQTRALYSLARLIRLARCSSSICFRKCINLNPRTASMISDWSL